MKRTILSTAIAAFAISLTFTSCSKDETAAPSGPTVLLTDSTGTGNVYTTNFFTSTWMTLKVTPSTGTTIDAIKTDVKVNGVTVTNDTYTTVDATQKNGYTESVPVSLLVSTLQIAFGKTVTFVINVKDNKGLVKTAELTYNVKVDHAILSSNEIELGAQTNATIPYKFVGIANNFATYTAGLTGTAKANSGKIDFVYYYGTTDKNAFAAPSNANGARIIWNSEINMWSVQNQTKFLPSTLTPTEFDNIKTTTKVDDTFAALNFSAGSTDKITSLAVGSVYAFQTAAGVKGLAKFTAISADEMGSTKVVLICQN